MENTLSDLKEQITMFSYCNATDFPQYNERMFRKAISELRKDGEIYIPSYKDGNYYHTSILTDEQIEQFAIAQVHHWKTQYFNTILPIKKFIKEETLRELMGELL